MNIRTLGLGLLVAACGTLPLFAQSNESNQSAASRIPWRSTTDPGLSAMTPASIAQAAQEQAASGHRHVLVRFGGPVGQETRAALRAAGVELLTYVGADAFFASISTERLSSASLQQVSSLRGVQPIEREHKLHPMLARGEVPHWAVVAMTDGAPSAPPEEVVGAYVIFHQDVTLETDGVGLCNLHGATVRSLLDTINSAVIELPYSQIEALAAEDAVQWIEPPLPRMSEVNDSNRARTQADLVQAAPYSLTGSGVNVLVYDGGTARSTHVDFQGRVFVRDGSGMHYHSTHVAGTIGGAGVQTAAYKGMAPGVTIQSYGLQTDGSGTFLYDNPGDLQADYNQAINTYGAVLSNNSIGTNVETNYFDCALQGNYGVTDQLIDSIVRGSLGAPFRIVWAAGNERQGSRCDVEGYGDYYSSAPPAGAKNHICVGAVNSNDDSMTSFSSWGPTDDGRMKPDISGPGCQSGGDNGVTSCDSTSDTAYRTLCGTSMAAPTVTGCAALIIQDFKVQYPSQPLFRNSTLKVWLAHTAVDLGNVGPDYQYGYGSIRVKDAIDFMRTGAFVENSIGQGGSYSRNIVVSAGDPELRVTLAWDDYPGTPAVNPALVNDLDLRVFGPGGTRYYPWTLTPTNPSAAAVRTQENHLDNLEQVLVSNPPAGTWTIEVYGYNVPQAPQSFSLVGDGAGVPPSGLSVTPGEGLGSSGPIGGPFSPSSKVYTLTNIGTTSFDYTVGKTAAWLTLSSAGGTLGGGASTNITVSINSNADSLGGGTYNDTVTFTNTTDHMGDTTRTVTLQVNAPSLVVTPSDGLSSSGSVGGPFSPSSKDYTLQNPGGSSINYTVAKTQSWVTLSGTNGTLTPGGSTTVTVSINSNANSLAVGGYGDTVTFTNTTNHIGDTTRPVSLTVNPLSNDLCANAFVVCPGTYTGTTVGMAREGSVNCDGTAGPDVWFKYTPGSSGSATFHGCSSGSTWDSVISVHSACVGTSSNQLACNDDGCGGTGTHGTITMNVTAGTTYIIRYGGYDSSNSGPFTLTITGPACADTTPPTPNPMTFASAPAPTSTTDIAMTASTATDAATPPVSYYFNFVSGGAGGNDSAWQLAPNSSFTDSGLTANTGYTYRVKARDSVAIPNETTYSSNAATATYIETPTGVSFGATDAASIVLNATGTFTNLTTSSSGVWFDSLTAGGDGGINAWVQTATDTATGLTANTLYTFQAKARNQSAVETPYSGPASKVTLANVPTAPTLGSPTTTTMTLDVNANGNPVATVYAIQCTATSPNDAAWLNKYVNAGGAPISVALWQTDAAWSVITIIGLQPATTYTFAVKARNQESVETAFGPGASLATLAQTGACCDPSNGSCTIQTQSACGALGGNYQGDGSTCVPNNCPLPSGSCCHNDGACAVTLQADCTGTWTMFGVCIPNTCPQPSGSCCQANGTCTETLQANCTGTWTMFGVCIPNTCPQPSGSCCHNDGACAVTLQADCTGTWTMFGVCDPNPCPQPTGACCYDAAPCAILTSADCTTGGGTYKGDGTTCTLHLCCVVMGDMSGDAVVDGADIQGFVEAMLAGFDPCADLALPYDVLDMADVSAFVDLLLGS